MTDLFDQDADVTFLNGAEPIDSQGDCDHGCWHKPGTLLAVGNGQRTDRLVACEKCGCRVWMTKNGIPATLWQKISRDDARMPRRKRR